MTTIIQHADGSRTQNKKRTPKRQPEANFKPQLKQGKDRAATMAIKSWEEAERRRLKEEMKEKAAEATKDLQPKKTSTRVTRVKQDTAPMPKPEKTKAQTAWEALQQETLDKHTQVETLEVIRITGKKGCLFVYPCPTRKKWVVAETLLHPDPLCGSQLREKVIKWARAQLLTP